MNNAKKILAILLVAAMAMSMFCVSAFADDSFDVTGHTYEAYQIFSGSQASDQGALGNVEWGAGIDGDAFLRDLQNDAELGGQFADCETAAQVAAVVSTWDDNSTSALAFARIANDNKTDATSLTVSNGKATISNPGYYLIVDTDDVDGEDDAVNLSLLAVSTTATIQTKTSVPTLEKKVLDINDTTGEPTSYTTDTSALATKTTETTIDTYEWQDSADYDIGDTIPYQLRAVMGDLTYYSAYYVCFNDTMTHLTYVANSAVVTIDGNVIDSDKYTVNWDATVKKLTVSIPDVIALGAEEGSLVFVTYDATLDAGANIGAEGNPNEAYLEFSNNPNEDYSGEGTPDSIGETTPDKNIVFTYKVIVDKIDESNQPLSGAGFTLYKKNASGTYEPVGEEVTETKVFEDDNTTVSAYRFTWTGLDDGEYSIKETTVPAGYNTADDVEFTITAEHAVTSDDPRLTGLEVIDEAGNSLSEQFSINVDNGEINTNIKNESGATLPTTGGIGTTLFYIFGTMLIIGAGTILGIRKRMLQS